MISIDRISIYIYLVILNCMLLFAGDTATLSVYTYNQDQSPLEGASVYIKNNETLESRGASSDKMGRTYFNEVPPGNYSIKVTFIGYKDIEKSFELTSSKNHEIKITMNLETISMTELEIINNKYNKSMVGAATSINAQSLEIMMPMGTQEILEIVPGINGFSDDGIGNSRINVGIRGINPRRSSRVLILEDGVPIQPALYVYPNMYYNPPSERISEVEVVKGSGAISFGPQTMGGVINYLTKKPTENSRPQIKFMLGENNYQSMFVETGDFSRNKLNPEFQLLLKQGDGFRDNNNFEQINGTIKFNYNKSKNQD